MKAAAGDPRGPILLRVARSSLERRLVYGVDELSAGATWRRAAWLGAPGASFVTLERRGALRGCIGSLDPVRPLIEDVHRNTLAAALEDPRFPPVAAEELDEISIEITLLSAARPLDVASEEEALSLLRPGTDGVVLHYAGRRATLLPQVWGAVASPAEFLAVLKRKAGLAADFWHPQVALERYSATSFSEPGRE